jgi:hypothetical protein
MDGIISESKAGTGAGRGFPGEQSLRDRCSTPAIAGPINVFSASSAAFTLPISLLQREVVSEDRLSSSDCP